MHASEKSAPKDQAQAYQWLLLASAGDEALVEETYRRLERLLNPEQRAEGLRLDREFNPKAERGK